MIHLKIAGSKFLFVFLFLLVLGVTEFTRAQQTFTFKIVDKETQEAIPGAKVNLDSLKMISISDVEGNAVLQNIPYGTHNFIVSSIGFDTTKFVLTFPTKQPEPFLIELESSEHLEEVIIEGTRSNKSISDTPTRTEALTDEIDEAASMEPGKVSHLLTHTTGIQVQTTSATSNGSVIRIQGLNGRYTQLLKDGFPMYGGFSGSLDILQIPPLDLRQVEFIKGPASTLYGGGAIGGIVNLITKSPLQNENLLHLNYSNIGARDFNSFVSRSFGTFGFTNLASMHLHNAYDADKDGFSDLAEVSKFNFNPRIYYSPSKRINIYFGLNVAIENRSGGDMNRILNDDFSITDFYLDRQKSKRYTSQFKTDFNLTERFSVTVKNSVSLFNRTIGIQENFADFIDFSGEQLNTFSEIQTSFKGKKHQFIAGLNFITDQFTETNTTSDTARNQFYQTIGIFLNETLDINQKISIELGMRSDYVNAFSERNQSDGKIFVLPRLNLLYKATKSLAFRIGGGMGYRMPTIFNEESEPLGYFGIKPIDFINTKAEESIGGNFDIKYITNFGSENLLFSFNQMFFYNIINNPILLIQNSSTEFAYENFGKQIHSRGFETQVKFTFWKITWFLGYTFNEAFLEDDSSSYWLTLTPKHSIKGDFLFVEENKWRIGVDYEFKSSQWLSTAVPTRSIFTTGIVIERTLGNFVLFFNAENVTDVRQSRFESLTSSPNNTPQNTEIWAPLDGRFFNMGLKIKL